MRDMPFEKRLAMLHTMQAHDARAENAETGRLAYETVTASIDRHLRDIARVTTDACLKTNGITSRY